MTTTANQPDRYALADIFSIPAPARIYPGLPAGITGRDASDLGAHDSMHRQPVRVEPQARRKTAAEKRYIGGWYNTGRYYDSLRCVDTGNCICPTGCPGC